MDCEFRVRIQAMTSEKRSLEMVFGVKLFEGNTYELKATLALSTFDIPTLAVECRIWR